MPTKTITAALSHPKQSKFRVWHDGDAWAWELRSRIGFVLLRRRGFASITLAMTDLDEIRTAGVFIPPTVRQQRQTQTQGEHDGL